MKKNFIQWKRSLVTSSVEILIAVYLAFHIASWKFTADEFPGNYSNFLEFMVPSYPVAQIDPVSGNWTNTYMFTQAQKKDFNDFMTWTNYQLDPNSDYSGPYWLNPLSCYKSKNNTFGNSVRLYSSPIIGYVKHGNQLEQDIIDQLTLLFKNQQSMVKMLSNMWKSGMADKLGMNISKVLVFDGFRINRTTFEPTTEYAPGQFIFKSFESIEEYYNYVSDPLYGSPQSPGICFGFSINETSTDKFELELIYDDHQERWEQKIAYQGQPPFKQNEFTPQIDGNFKKQHQYGFDLMMNIGATTILKRKTGVHNATILNMLVPAPSKPIMSYGSFWNFQMFMFLLILGMWMPLVYSTVFRIVVEKQTKIQETMLIMGMSEISYWGSWYAFFTILQSVIAVIAYVVLQSTCFPKSNPLILFATLWGFGQSIFGMIMAIQSLFSQARWASIITTLFYFSITQAHFMLLQENNYEMHRVMSIISPGVAMAQTMRNLVFWNEYGGGCNFQNWNFPLFTISVKESLFCLYLSLILWLFLGILLENAIPKPFGVKKNWFRALIQKTFNCKNQVSSNQQDSCNQNEEFFEQATEEDNMKQSKNLALEVKDLYKVYEDGFKAVNGVNLTLYEDQIFVLLGHNGAGKTTTISMLSGLLPKTTGNAQVYGVSLFSQMDEVRKFMGVCPQYDVLFDLLTPEEHLDFFYEMKGAVTDQVQKRSEIDKLLQEVGVDDKRNAMAQTLSGGNKRKLSVAIALIGGSKFVIFDEPTAGMDLDARRHMWECLKKHKKNKIILMSTHYMDEADILGDRIGIMVGGKLSCVGSSIFLKTKFGLGFNMNLVKQSTEQNQVLMPFIHENLGPKVILTSEIQSEICIKIPTEYQSKFSSFFELFDQRLENLRIINYGISQSTLEEVFMIFGHAATHMQDNKDQTPQEQKIQPNYSLTDGVIDTSFKNNLKAVLYRKIKTYKNGKLALVFELGLPLILGIFGCISVKFANEYPDSDPRLLTADLIPKGSKIMINSAVYDTKNSDLSLSQILDNFPKNLDFHFTENDTSLFQFNNQSLAFGNSFGSPPWHYGDYFMFQANNKTKNFKFLTWANTTTTGPVAIYPAVMYETLLKTATGNKNLEFKVKITPPKMNYDQYLAVLQRAVMGLQYGFGLSFGIMLSTIVGFLVVERLSGRKHLQKLAGLQLVAYWIGNFIVDFVKVEIVILADILFMYLMGMKWKATNYILPLTPFVVLPFCYVISFVFPNDNLAYLCTLLIVFFPDAIVAMQTWYNRISEKNGQNGDLANTVLSFLPPYYLSQVTFTDSWGPLIAAYRKYVYFEGTGKLISEEIWSYDQQSGVVMMGMINFVIWSIALVLIETDWKQNKVKETISSKLEPEEDVEQENLRVANDCQDQILVQNFSKDFMQLQKKSCKRQRFFAVKNLSFGVKKGECFALLGVNGAGKSTTFKSLTKEVDYNQGVIKICGFDLEKDFDSARKLIGYCPQYNLIFSDLAVFEHINYYAMLKGIPQDICEIIVDEVISRLGLDHQKNKLVSSLSGGNQRKVCVAMAIVGNPPIILLDEPSAGMDPEARRFMWNVVAQITLKQQSAIVLTTHSMEEAEALCTKMGIMVKGGVFKCFGSSQHIRHKFGTGFVIEIKIRTLDESELDEKNKFKSNQEFFTSQITQDWGQSVRIQHALFNLYKCIHELCQHFGKVELIEHYGSYMRLRVARNNLSIGKLFGLIESKKQSLEISEYSVNQTTLEQIFQNFADVHFQENIKTFEIKDGVLQQIM